MRLDHVALTVGDRAASLAFYREHLGLTETFHDDEHLLIIGPEDGGLLALDEGDPAPDSIRTTHFGFRLDHPDDVRAARERFREAGLTETEWQDEGTVRVQILDPDGYRVELYAF